MVDFTWGTLPKAQDDPQLITEAIAQAIADHEADPEAHLGVGESLEQHKTNEVIDHPAVSIVPDKFNSANNFFLLPVNGDISGQGDNFSSLFPGFTASMEQDSPLTGDATFNVYDFSASDFLYNGGDVVADFIYFASGSSGTWQTYFNFSFATIQLKSGNIRFGYYDGSWHYSSWTSFSPATVHKFRIHFDSASGHLVFYINGLSAYDVAYSTLHLDGGDFAIQIGLNRGTSANSGVNFGNINFGFDSNS